MNRIVQSFVIGFCFLCLSASVQAQPEGRNYWIERYLSVSYPLKGIKVCSPYGSRKDPFTGQKSNHSGLDLQAYYEEVYAMFDGQVLKIGSDSRSGNYVVLQHGDYTVSYCHLSKVAATVGEEVLAGDVVGVSGSTGRSTGPHLHLTCKYQGKVTDPYPLLLYINNVRAEAFSALLGDVGGLKNTDRRAFLARYADAAMEQQRQYGIPASVTLAQMAFESDWGRCQTATVVVANTPPPTTTTGLLLSNPLATLPPGTTSNSSNKSSNATSCICTIDWLPNKLT